MKRVLVIMAGAALAACGGEKTPAPDAQSPAQPAAAQVNGSEAQAAIRPLALDADQLPDDPIPFNQVNGKATPKTVYPSDCPFLSDAEAVKMDRRSPELQLVKKADFGCEWESNDAFPIGIGVSLSDGERLSPAVIREGLRKDYRGVTDVDGVGDEAFFVHLQEGDENPVSLNVWIDGKRVSVGGLQTRGDKDAMIAAALKVLANADAAPPDLDVETVQDIYEYNACELYTVDSLSAFFGDGDGVYVNAGGYNGAANESCSWSYSQTLKGVSVTQHPRLNVEFRFADGPVEDWARKEKLIASSNGDIYRHQIDNTGGEIKTTYLTELGTSASMTVTVDHKRIDDIDATITPLIENIRARMVF